ncbi:uncharacterized protein LOC133423200 [Cololabis saira]|uniref:uncharacterized protein LOC133423200 n=1 Tax=Cololabis saira TaxID=129043 RepID=UPI002AD48DC0|nr:uncharacterized protein LOC133423200 [Cololabis saira]XP_061569340.1 uncharacterized protein LOC133423200 [Cololabis saira]XP_061569341.1 uncharacterized protein LOC133423200 [Cololabis saira]
MEVFDSLGIKIPNAVLVSGNTKDLSDVEEVIDFLKQYGIIGRATVVDAIESDFHENWVVEYSSGTAVVTLESLLPYTFVTKDGKNTYQIRDLSSMYAEREGDKKTQAYLEDLKQLAKVSGMNYAEVLKGMMSHISKSITALEPAITAEEEEEEEEEEEGGAPEIKSPPQSPWKISPGSAAHPVFKPLPRAQSAGIKSNTIAADDVNPPEVQRPGFVIPDGELFQNPVIRSPRGGTRNHTQQ